MTPDILTPCTVSGCPHYATGGGRCPDHATGAPPLDPSPIGLDCAQLMGDLVPVAETIEWQAIIVRTLDADGDPFTHVVARSQHPDGADSHLTLARDLFDVAAQIASPGRCAVNARVRPIDVGPGSKETEPIEGDE